MIKVRFVQLDRNSIEFSNVLKKQLEDELNEIKRENIIAVTQFSPHDYTIIYEAKESDAPIYKYDDEE
jgi:hypothetical protein